MKPLSKVFILTQFGTPHSWTEEYFNNIAKLEQYGYYWKIFTPNTYENVPSNVEIIPMTIEELNALMEEKIGVNPENYITDAGIPSKHVSDFYVASGAIFEDYIKDYDMWGITNWDVVYGRLPLFIPDEVLEESDIFSDDVNTINGVFCLFKNNEEMRWLFKEIPQWEYKFKTHQLFATDEYDMTAVARTKKGITFMGPHYYPLHSHDRLEQHTPEPKLKIEADGSLWELFKDINGPIWEHMRPYLGREIPYFHFCRTKEWPLCLIKN